MWLGHKNENVTQIYLDSFGSEIIDNALAPPIINFKPPPFLQYTNRSQELQGHQYLFHCKSAVRTCI